MLRDIKERSIKLKFSWVWWYGPLIPLFGRLRQMDLCASEAILGYKVRSCLKQNKTHKQTKKSLDGFLLTKDYI